MKGFKKLVCILLMTVMAASFFSGGVFAKEAEYTDEPKFLVTLAQPEHGTLTLENSDEKTALFAEADSVRVDAAAEDGYKVEAYIVTNTADQEMVYYDESDDSGWLFEMPDFDVTVTAEVVPDMDEPVSDEVSESIGDADPDEELPASAEETVSDIEQDVQDAICDPVIENYIKEHVNRAYSEYKEEDFGMVNIMTVRQTLFDAALVEPEDTIDSIIGAIEEDAGSEEFHKLIAQFSNYNIPLYNLCADSEYLVAMADTMVNQENSTVKEAVFAYTNNRGQKLENCIYDMETGLAYIPKAEMFDKDEYRFNCVQIQLMQLVRPETDTMVIPSISAKESEDAADDHVTMTDLIETETTVNVAKNLDEEHLVVTVNGYPESEEAYMYDAEEGTLTINEYPATVQSVVVTEEKETLGDKIDDLAKTLHLLNEVHAVSANDMKLLGDPVTLPDWVSKGTLVTGTVAFQYTGNQGWSGSYNYRGDASYVMNAVNSGSIDMSKVDKPSSGAYFTIGLQFAPGVATTTNTGNVYYSMASDLTKGLDLSKWGYVCLECDHILTDLGTTTNAQTQGGRWFPGNVKIRFFDINESAGYAIVGIYTVESHNQSGFGILKMAIGKANGTVSIGKKGATTGEQIPGATYYVYTSRACTAYANDVNGRHTFVTTSNAAPKCSNILTYPAGTYYVREANTNLPAGTEWNNTVYSFTIKPGAHVYAGGGWVKDNEFGDGKLEKKSTEDGSMVANAEYRVYTDAECKVIAKTTAGKDAVFTTTSTGSNTLRMRPGTYYVKEYKAAPGFRLSENVYKLTVNRGKTVKLDVKNEPNTGSMYILKQSADQDMTGANKAYSLEGAEYGIYATAADAKKDEDRIEVLTTDQEGKTPVLALKSGADGITYYVKELTPSAGFLLCDGNDGSDDGVHEVTIHTDETSIVKCREPLATAEFPLRLQKYDAGTDLAAAQGTASLKGGIFAVEFWNNCTGATSEEPDSTWYYLTDETGSFNVRDEQYLLQTYTFGKEQSQTAYAGQTITSSPLHKDDGGNIFFYMGTYRVREISPPELYQLNGTIRLAGESENKAASVEEGCVLVIDYNTTEHTAQYKRSGVVTEAEKLLLYAADYVHLGVLSVTKYGKGNQPLADVRYKLVRAQDEKIMDSMTTGADGTAVWENLIPGDYILTEAGTADGYNLLEDNIEIHIPCQMTLEMLQESKADKNKAYFDEASRTFCFEAVNYDITDSAKFDIPMAGGNHMALCFLMAAAFALIAAGLLLTGRKRMRE